MPLICRIDDAGAECGQRRRARAQETRALLLSRVRARVLDADGNDFPATRLHTTNKDVNSDNAAELAKLPGEARSYAVRVTLPRGDVVGLGHEAPRDSPLDKLARDAPGKWDDVALKAGATVVLLANVNPAAGLFNGAVGRVEACGDDAVRVRFRGGPVDVLRAELGVGDLRVSYMPLRLGYAATVHKSQGMTLDACVIHLQFSMPAASAYTAISRVRSLDSLVIEVPPDADPAHVFERAFRTSDVAADFMASIGLM